jgi:hypothetical protein
VIVVVEINLVAFDKRQWFEAAGFVQIEFLRVVALFAPQRVAVPEEFGSTERILLAHAAAEGVVGVVEGLAVFFYLHQLVLFVVLVAGDNGAVFAAAFFDQVAAPVVMKVAVTVEAQTVACANVAGLLAGRLRTATKDVARQIEFELLAGVAFRRFQSI